MASPMRRISIQKPVSNICVLRDESKPVCIMCGEDRRAMLMKNLIFGRIIRTKLPSSSIRETINDHHLFEKIAFSSFSSKC